MSWKLWSGFSGGGGGVGGSTGGTDKTILMSNGTGGSTLQATDITMDSNGNMIFPADTNFANHTLQFASSGVKLMNYPGSPTQFLIRTDTFRIELVDGSFTWSCDNTNMRYRAAADNNHYMGFNVPNSTTQTLQASDSMNVNVNVGTSAVTAITIATTGTVGLPTSIDSASAADTVTLSSYDLSAGNRTLAIGTETAVVTETVVSDRTLSVRINGTTYKICLKS